MGLTAKAPARGVIVSEEKGPPQLTFWDHLNELFARLRIVLISVLFSGSVIAFMPLDPRALTNPTELYAPLVSVILKRLVADTLPPGTHLIAGGLIDTAYVYLVMAAVIGVLVSSPVAAYELYKFVNPALYEHERRFAMRFVASFIALFAFGCTFSYLLIVPITVKILVWFIINSGAEPLINIKDYVSMIMLLVLGTGFVYTIPIYIVVLVQRGIITHEYLVRNRKMIYAAFLIIAAIITPDPTPITTIIAFLPFVVLFELVIVITRPKAAEADISLTSAPR